MSLNSFAHLYEAETIDTVRHVIAPILQTRLPPIGPDMRVLDLGCGSGAVTRIIYEQSATRGVKPPKVFGVDLGPSFIDAFNENKKAYSWDTAEGIVADASNLDMFADQTFDVVIMSFSLFAVQDAVVEKATAEVYRVLKPGGFFAASTWRGENFVERSKQLSDFTHGYSLIRVRVFVSTTAIMGRPPEECDKFKTGKWQKVETARDAIVAGGFEINKILAIPEDYFWAFESKEAMLNRFNASFWRGIATSVWTEEQKAKWPAAVEAILTEEEKSSASVPMFYCTHVAQK